MSGRILYIMAGLPWPCDRGDRIRNYHLLKALTIDNDVTLLTLDAEPADELPEGSAVCRHVSADLTLIQQCMGVFEHPGVPVTASRRGGHFADRRVRRILHEMTWDVVVAAQLRAAPAAFAVEGAPHILDLTDSLWSLRSQEAAGMQSPWRRLLPELESGRARRYESFALSKADLVTVASEADATALRQLADDALITVVPNGVDAEFCPVVSSSEQGVLFVGNCLYGPNLTGLLWFVREVWPLLRAVEPSCTLDVVGSMSRGAASSLRDIPGIQIHGYMPDIGLLLSHAAVVINPVLAGAGTALKSLEAMIWGKALVATPAGSRSLDLHSGIDGMVAEAPAEFADAIHRCLADPVLRSRMGAAARKKAQAQFSWKLAETRWRALVMDIAGKNA